MENHSKGRQFLKDFFTLALPICIGNLFTFGVPFYSHFITASLGEDLSSGIFLSNQIFQLLVFVITGLEAAVAILGAQSVGAGNKPALLRAVRLSALLALLISGCLSALCLLFPGSVLSVLSADNAVTGSAVRYLRLIAPGFPLYALSRILIAASKCTGHPMIALGAPAVSFFVNLFFSLLLVRAPLSLGSVGVGIASLAARGAELGVVILCIPREKTARERQFLKPTDEGGKGYWRTLAPILLGQIVWAAYNLLLTTLMARVDGGEAAAAFGVAGSLSNLAYAFMNAASSAVGIIVSRRVGEGEGSEQSVIHAASRGQRIFLLIGLFSALFISLLGKPFIHLYRLSGSSADTAASLIRILAPSFVATSYSAASLFGIIKSGGDVGFVLCTDALSLLLVTLPLSLMCYRLEVGAATLYAVLKLEHLLKCPIAAAKIKRHDWIRRLTNSS